MCDEKFNRICFLFCRYYFLLCNFCLGFMWIFLDHKNELRSGIFVSCVKTFVLYPKLWYIAKSFQMCYDENWKIPNWMKIPKTFESHYRAQSVSAPDCSDYATIFYPRFFLYFFLSFRMRTSDTGLKRD